MPDRGYDEDISNSNCVEYEDISNYIEPDVVTNLEIFMT